MGWPIIPMSATACPAYSIWIEGQLLPLDVTQHILSFSYTDAEEDSMDAFEIELTNRHLQFTDSDYFQEGNVVEMQFGYAPMNFTGVRKGKINGITATFPSDGEPKLVVKGSCLAAQLAGKQIYGVWTRVYRGDIDGSANMPTTPAQAALLGILNGAMIALGPQVGYTPSEIAIELAKFYKLKPVVEMTLNRQVWRQCGESDYDFLTRLAKEAVYNKGPNDVGFGFWVEGDELHFHSVKRAGVQDVIMQLVYGVDDQGMLQTFTVEQDVQANQGEATEVAAAEVDPRRMKLTGFLALNSTAEGRTALAPQTALEPGKGGTKKNQTYRPFIEVVEPEPETHTLADPKSEKVTERRLVTNAGTRTRVTAEPEPIWPMFGRGPGWPMFKRVQQVANAKYQKASDEELRVAAVTIGWPMLRAKALVDIQGVGLKYGGIYAITKVVHEFNKGYRCKLELKRPAIGREGTYTAEVDGKVVELPGEAGPAPGTEQKFVEKVPVPAPVGI